MKGRELNGVGERSGCACHNCCWDRGLDFRCCCASKKAQQPNRHVDLGLLPVVVTFATAFSYLKHSAVARRLTIPRQQTVDGLLDVSTPQHLVTTKDEGMTSEYLFAVIS